MSSVSSEKREPFARAFQRNPAPLMRSDSLSFSYTSAGVPKTDPEFLRTMLRRNCPCSGCDRCATPTVASSRIGGDGVEERADHQGGEGFDLRRVAFLVVPGGI